MFNTKRSFQDKWNNNVELLFLDTLDEKSDVHKWILNRNGFSAIADLRKFLEGKKRILDAGCGNGRVTALIRKNAPISAEVLGFDLISPSIPKQISIGFR